MIPWADAKIHVLSHALHYGTSVFEGIRAYGTPTGPAIFRLEEHLIRLEDSGRMYGMEMPFDRDTVRAACQSVVRDNGLKSAYLRPIAFLGDCGMGVVPAPERMNVDLVIAAFPWGAYLGEEGLTQGVDVCVSSWNRLAPNTAPTGAKAGGNYLSSFLIGKEARDHGYAEGIGLSTDGRLSEGAGENLFLVKDGVLITPPAASSILVGITRDTVLQLAADNGIPTREQVLPREALYTADEVFMTGTAAEITPIRSVDRIPTRSKGPGPITRLLQGQFMGLFSGQTPDRHGWLTPVPVAQTKEVAYA